MYLVYEHTYTYHGRKEGKGEKIEERVRKPTKTRLCVETNELHWIQCKPRFFFRFLSMSLLEIVLTRFRDSVACLLVLDFIFCIYCLTSWFNIMVFHPMLIIVYICSMVKTTRYNRLRFLNYNVENTISSETMCSSTRAVCCF